MRCVRPDESSATITLHYCRDGAIFFRFSMRKQEFLIPVILVLRALSSKSTDKVFFVSSIYSFRTSLSELHVEMNQKLS
jgi:hypothetical protein